MKDKNVIHPDRLDVLIDLEADYRYDEIRGALFQGRKDHLDQQLLRVL